MHLFQKFLLGTYNFFKKSGLMENRWFNQLFLFSYFIYKKYFEDPFWGLIKNYSEMFQGGHILDIGANIGYTSILFSKAISSGFNVYSFEPDRSNFIRLNEAIGTHKASGKIIPVQAAVGDTNGTVEFWHNEKHHGDHRILTQQYKKSGIDLMKVSVVPIWCIDSFVKSEQIESNLKFIKIDVQGYELPVCLGMQQTLAANPNAVVALEYAPSSMSELGFAPEKVLQLFQEWGYLIYILHKKGNLEPARDEILDLLIKKRGYIDLIFSKKQIFM